MVAARYLTEAQFQSQVIDLARLFGWKVHHDRPARTPDGQYLTRTEGDSGFPDLVLARDGQVVFAELKSETGRLGASQVEWLQNLEDGPDAHDHVLVRVWRPSDLEQIKRVLR